jgi:uncharacterized protein (DUF302 family)
VKKILLILSFLCAAAFANNGFLLFETMLDDKALIAASKAAVEKAGFVPADERDLAVAFGKQFEQTDFELYYNLTVLDPKALGAAIADVPSIGAFAPYTVLLYKKKGEAKSYFGFVKTEAMNAALTLSPKATKAMKESEKRLQKQLLAAIKDAKPVKLGYKSVLKSDKELHFSTALKLKANENALAKKEAVQKEFESALEVEGFKISNITDLKTELEKVKVDMSKFEFYDTYSICKLKVIYNASKQRPETGVFAPCSVYFYKLKGNDKIYMGFPTTKNWVTNTNITNGEYIKVMKDAEGVAVKSLSEME